jgi:hypothetical protein
MTEPAGVIFSTLTEMFTPRFDDFMLMFLFNFSKQKRKVMFQSPSFFCIYLYCFGNNVSVFV